MIRKISTFGILSIFCFSMISAYQEKESIPEFFGIYLVADGKLIELKKSEVAAKNPPKECCGSDYISGVERLSGINITDRDFSIILFIQGLDIDRIKLSRLGFKDFFILSCQPCKLGTSKRKINTRINMWIKAQDIPFKIGPVEDRREMYRIVPSSPIRPGIYALNFGSLWHSWIGNISGLPFAMAEVETGAYDFSLGLLIEEDVIKLTDEAETLFHEYRLDEALEKYKKASQIQPDWSEPHAYMGFIYKKKGDYTNAIDSLRKYLQLDSHSERAIEIREELNNVQKLKKAEEIRSSFLKKRQEIRSSLSEEEIKLKLVEKLDKARYYLTSAKNCSITQPARMVIEELLKSRKYLAESLLFADDEVRKVIEGYIYRADNIKRRLRASGKIGTTRELNKIRKELKTFIKKIKSNN